MLKRKRDWDGPPGDAANGGATQRQVTRALDDGVARLVSRFKLAKQFERQKLSRRERTARNANDQEAVHRIHEEIAFLRDLNNTYLSELTIQKTLRKIKAAVASELFAGFLALPCRPLQGSLAQNIYSRLCRSVVVMGTLDLVMDEVLAAANIESKSKNREAREKKVERQNMAREKKKAWEARQAEKAERDYHRRSRPDGILPDEVGAVDRGQLELVNGAHKRDETLADGEELGSEDDFEQYQDRLAGSDDDDEDMDVAELEQQLRAEGVADDESADGSDSEQRPARSSRLADHDFSDDSDVGLSDEEDARPKARSRTTSKPQIDHDISDIPSEDDTEEERRSRTSRPQRDPSSKISTSKTTASSKSQPAPLSKISSSILLPSLTMGGYISADDGSEAEELDERPRKNRRGQRARQAIWEQKYGTKAKHLEKGDQGRDQGWDMKRGATDGSKRGGFGRGGFSRGGFAGGRTGQSDNPNLTTLGKPKPPKRDDTGKLHPSWEAAKRAKEQKATQVFAGKKISFD